MDFSYVRHIRRHLDGLYKGRPPEKDKVFFWQSPETSPLAISGNLYLFFECQKRLFVRTTEMPIMIMTVAMII